MKQMVYQLVWKVIDLSTGDTICSNVSYSQDLDKFPKSLPANVELNIIGNRICQCENPEIQLPFHGNLKAKLVKYNPVREREIRKKFDNEFNALLDKYDAYLAIHGEYRGDNRTVGGRLKFNDRSIFFDIEETTVNILCEICQGQIDIKI